MWYDQFKFLVFEIIKRVFLYRIKANIFLLKLKRILTKIDISYMCQMVTSDSQSARPIHPLVSIWCKLWEDLIWVTPKKNRFLPNVILKLSHALDGLFSVLIILNIIVSVLIMVVNKSALFAEWSITELDVTTLRYCCLGFFLAWKLLFILLFLFSVIARCSDGHFPDRLW